MAWVLKLKQTLFAKRNKEDEKFQANQCPLTAHELEESRKYLNKEAQKNLHSRLRNY